MGFSSPLVFIYQSLMSCKKKYIERVVRNNSHTHARVSRGEVSSATIGSPYVRAFVCELYWIYPLHILFLQLIIELLYKY